MPSLQINIRNCLSIVLFSALPTLLYACSKNDGIENDSDSMDLRENPMANLNYDPTFNYFHYNKEENITLFDFSQKERIKALCAQSHNYGKTVGIFGGSHTCSASSWVYLTWYKEFLGLTTTVYGIGGQGYSSLQGSIQNQVDRAGVHDIYILWCSTNDFAGNRRPGQTTDFTAADNWYSPNRESQCGGLNYCIQRLRLKNPQAKIFVFGSFKFFTSEVGYNWNTRFTNRIGYPYRHYITLQKDCADQADVPFFDQWNSIPLTNEQLKKCFHADNLHYNCTGYANIALYQMEFIATH